jgi:hypothetical protein
MTDLLALLGDEWAVRKPEAAKLVEECTGKDRRDVSHGCRACGRAPLTWSDAYGTYLDGMGRPTRCNYCRSCVGSGRTAVRDPWTDELLAWNGAPCLYCAGTGWTGHAWNCDQLWHHDHMTIHEWYPATVYGVTFDGRTVFPESSEQEQGQ